MYIVYIVISPIGLYVYTIFEFLKVKRIKYLLAKHVTTVTVANSKNKIIFNTIIIL